MNKLTFLLFIGVCLMAVSFAQGWDWWGDDDWDWSDRGRLCIHGICNRNCVKHGFGHGRCVRNRCRCFGKGADWWGDDWWW